MDEVNEDGYFVEHEYIVFFFQLNEVNEGGYFGERGLITRQPRATNIVAIGDVKVACK